MRGKVLALQSYSMGGIWRQTPERQERFGAYSDPYLG